MSKKVGRPSGPIKTSKIEVPIEPKLKETFMELARKNGSNASVEICRMISDYVKKYANNIGGG